MRHPAPLTCAACLAVASILAPAPAHAGPPEDVVELRILPGWTTEDGTHMAGLQLTLLPGWKTYWRAPGDAGIPPLFDWRGSDNIAAARFHWPVPEVFDQNGMQSIGYGDQVVIPVELTPLRPGAPTRMSGEVEIGVCQEICIPVTLQFDALLPPDSGRDPAIAAALVDRPLTRTEAGVGLVTCAVAPLADGVALTAAIEMGSAGTPEVVVIEAGDPFVWVSEAKTRREGGWLTAAVEMVHVSGTAFALDRSAVRITVLGTTHAVDIQGCSAG